MDLRIQDTVEKLREYLELSYGDFDRISMAGGAGNFEQLESHIRTSFRLHNPDELIFSVHEDCGAGAKREDLYKAYAIAKGIAPEVKVRCFYIKLDGTYEEVPMVDFESMKEGEFSVAQEGM